MATDFFEQQDSARRQSGWLVLLFALSVVAIIAAIYAVATLLTMSAAKGPQTVPAFDVGRLGIVATAVLVVISGGSLYKVWALSDGGDGVARMLGGRLISPSTDDPAERRLLNVVEEMALAAGTPVPPVYLLDEEPSINAFAAGLTPGDAVIGVSKGCLDHLSRDEIQGVVGHEFSHILNGDMRLNLRLMGLIHGILVISLVGQILFRIAAHSRPRSSRDNEKGGGAAVFLLVGGVALWLIGLIGVFFGRLIKCAVSRQREFLADASAVQFTRNPEGLAGALKKIGGLQEGSRLRTPNAEQAAHMFFSQGVFSLSRLLATHPPLEERIRRLDPQFSGAFPREPEGRTVTFSAEERDEAAARAVGLADASRSVARGVAAPSRVDTTPYRLSPHEALASVGAPSEAHMEYANELLHGLPPILNEAARDPFSARAVVYALLIDEDENVAQGQLDHLDSGGARGTAVETLRLLPAVRSLGRSARIPLADLTFPA
ncbi:MAG: M48 family metallopeptidase, partial [Isosphaeraceae bacterium]